ncbi:hypothetical protein RHMOL_Rhmol08G0172500 [Rhododendron molle]|uniref:Uncharacterized protein n=1 Tax=Rhododendron molle TaxID=49168 RepID=A0ACC0MRC7_RHOML|nr:hypothetical protein RHMOL_Rhmol08G0172500 [Rhododendron molle]
MTKVLNLLPLRLTTFGPSLRYNGFDDAESTVLRLEMPCSGRFVHFLICAWRNAAVAVLNTRSLQPSRLSSPSIKTPSPQRSQSLPGTSRSSSQQIPLSTTSQANSPASIPRMADNDTARDVEDKKDEEEAENPREVVLVGKSELTKQVKEIKHALAHSQGDQILDFEGLCLFPDSQLPKKFKMPNIEKFNGTGNPTSHVRHVINTLKPMGLNDELIAQLFQRTLTRSALDWFLTFEFEHYHTWPEIANAFIKQYAYNVQVELTTRDLEMTKQESNEDVVTFVARGREKAAKMRTVPLRKIK